jgi:hypothetical protein
MTLDDMLEAAEKWVREMLINRPGVQIPPTFMLITKSECKVISMPWENSKQRSIALSLIQLMMKHKNVISYSVVSEAWKASEPKDPRKRSGLMPSQRQDKKEIIMIVAVNKIENKSIEFDIVRNDEAVVINLVKSPDLIKSTGGELLTLLDD